MQMLNYRRVVPRPPPDYAAGMGSSIDTSMKELIQQAQLAKEFGLKPGQPLGNAAFYQSLDPRTLQSQLDFENRQIEKYRTQYTNILRDNRNRFDFVRGKLTNDHVSGILAHEAAVNGPTPPRSQPQIRTDEQDFLPHNYESLKDAYAKKYNPTPREPLKEESHAPVVNRALYNGRYRVDRNLSNVNLKPEEERLSQGGVDDNLENDRSVMMKSSSAGVLQTGALNNAPFNELKKDLQVLRRRLYQDGEGNLEAYMKESAKLIEKQNEVLKTTNDPEAAAYFRAALQRRLEAKMDPNRKQRLKWKIRQEEEAMKRAIDPLSMICLLYTSPSPRDQA
eukprot:TRINITY_DN3917_c0_g1_i7.p1 TRINITY_DN3917_c0_g1~~TRINITY_DN3917_c0_g1_i7.p1  ORF type:complete len:336 (-),score=65.23 TRINITY_DN3917_c0_g1_i7:38-1045(-)